MRSATFDCSPFRSAFSVGLAGLLSLLPLIVRAQAPSQAVEKATERKANPERPHAPWRAFGKVTSHDGKPLAGVEVWANCGMGTLHRTGVATSGDDGLYVLNFGPGIAILSQGVSTQAATISAHKAGYFEENLNRQGACSAADGMPSDEQMKQWGSRKDRHFLPERPLELNFVMRPSGRVAGKLVDEQGKPLPGYSVSLNGAELPPSSSAMCSTHADEHGRFTLEDIPTTFRFQFEVRKADPKPPWDDSWASAALRFELPEKKEDIRAWFGKREIRLQEFVLRVAGPGVHGREAVPMAGNAAMLNLTDPSDVSERSDTGLVARSATLTLRNTPGTGRP